MLAKLLAGCLSKGSPGIPRVDSAASWSAVRCSSPGTHQGVEGSVGFGEIPVGELAVTNSQTTVTESGTAILGLLATPKDWCPYRVAEATREDEVYYLLPPLSHPS